MSDFQSNKQNNICSTPGCGKSATMSCPTCTKLGLSEAYFCEQGCFKDYWHEHKDLHRWRGDAVAILRESNGIMDYLQLAEISKDFPIEIEGTQFNCSIKCCKTFTLNKKERDEIYLLLENNMRSFYEATWGWDKDSKLKELFDPGAYFIVLTSPDLELMAFAMFKFTWDDEEEPEFPVLFCYELQVNTKYHGKGIGKKFVEIQLKIANKRNMWKTMLTCFKINTQAMQFYLKAGFGIDANSPSAHSADVDYEILSDKPSRKS